MKHYAEDRNKRGEGKRVRDRSNHGKSAPPWPDPCPRLSLTAFALLAGGTDLRTSKHRPKKEKRAALETVGQPPPAAPPAATRPVTSPGVPVLVWADGDTEAGEMRAIVQYIPGLKRVVNVIVIVRR